MRSTLYRPATLSFSIFALLNASCAVETHTEPQEDRDAANASSALVTGTATSLRPEVGRFLTQSSDGSYYSSCTATLVDPSYVLTAAHCVGFATSPVLIPSQFAVDGQPSGIPMTRTYAFGRALGDGDIAFVRLQTPVPPSVATPAPIAGALPSTGTAATVFGYGCQLRPSYGGGMKQYVPFAVGSATQVLCPGDSGGPSFYGPPDGNGAIFQVNSGYHNSDGTDVFAEVVTNGNDALRALRKFGGFDEPNPALSEFAAVGAQSNVRALAGHFNADSYGDIALVGGYDWHSVPIAWGNAGANYTYTNKQTGIFATLGNAATFALAGDFNGDHLTDIAFLGNPNWNTIPVGLSNGDGTFNFKNYQLPVFASLANQPNVQAVVGDFDADGDDDIALVGGSTWNTIPVAHAFPDGSFSFTNDWVNDFPVYARTPGVRAFAGDFDGDGRKDDIALTGPAAWTTVPIAFRNGTQWTSTNPSNPNFASMAATAGTKITVGDFDGDNDDDLAIAGGAGWTSVGFALTNQAGFGFLNWDTANLPTANFHSWSTVATSMVATDVDNDHRAELVLTGGSTWGSVPTLRLRP